MNLKQAGIMSQIYIDDVHMSFKFASNFLFQNRILSYAWMRNTVKYFKFLIQSKSKKLKFSFALPHKIRYNKSKSLKSFNYFFNIKEKFSDLGLHFNMVTWPHYSNVCLQGSRGGVKSQSYFPTNSCSYHSPQNRWGDKMQCAYCRRFQACVNLRLA